MDDKEGKWKFVSTEKKKKKKPQEKEATSTNSKNSKKNSKTGKANKKTKPEKQYAVPGNVSEDVYIPPNKLKLLEQEKREQELKKKLKEKEKKKKNRARNNENQNQDLLSVDEIIDEIVIEDYKEWLSQLKSEFKKNHDARLKKFADFFINKFSKCGTEIYFDEFAKPLYLIDEKINELTFEYLQDIKQEEAVEFYWFLVDLLVNPQKNLNKVGVMLVLQYTANQWSEAILKTFDIHVEKYLEPKKKRDWKDVDKNLPALLWSIIQTGKCTSGIISIWSKYFLPLLGKSDSFDVKNMVIRFVEHLVSQPAFESSIDYVAFPPNYKLLASSFEGLMLAMVSGVLDENFTQRLNHIYLPMRKAIFEDENLKKSNFFEMLLIHAASKFQVFRNEALICLNKCLEIDRDCFDIWRRIYSENLAQSNNLLVYTRNHWGTPKLKIEDEELFSLLSHFTGINKKIDYGEWKFETKMSEEEEIKIRRMALICNDSIIKLKKVMSTGKLFMILCFVLLLLVLFSIYFYFNPLQS